MNISTVLAVTNTNPFRKFVTILLIVIIPFVFVALLLASPAQTMALTPTHSPSNDCPVTCTYSTKVITFAPTWGNTPPNLTMYYSPTTRLCMNHNFTATMTGTFAYDYGSDACYMSSGLSGVISDALSGAWVPIVAYGGSCVDGGSAGPWAYQGVFDRSGSDIPFELRTINKNWRGEALYPFHVGISESVLTGCFAEPPICGVLNDYDFYAPTTWTPDPDVTWSNHEWTLAYNSQLKQSVTLSQTGIYTIAVRAKNPFSGDERTLSFFLYPGGSGSVVHIPPGATYAMFTTTISVDHIGTYQFILSANASVVVDSVCLSYTAINSSCPCGLTITDTQRNMLRNSGFESGIDFPFGSCELKYPFSCGIVDTQWQAIPGWSIRQFPPSIIQGVKRSGYDVGYSMGLIAPNYSSGIKQDISMAESQFNVLMRIKPRWSNTILHIGSSDGDILATGFLTPGMWHELSVFYDMPSSGNWPVTIYAGCDGACIGRDNSSDPSTDIVDVDDVCAIPMDGPLACGTTVPTVTVPALKCINSNPHFGDGPDGPMMPANGSTYEGAAYGWHWISARVGNPLGTYPHSARLYVYGTGSQVSQLIPISQGVTDRDSSIVIGQPYHLTGDVQVLSFGSSDISFRAILDGTVLNSIDLNSGVGSISYDTIFTVTPEMVSNGAVALYLQLLGTNSTSTILDYACVSEIVTPTVPYSNCLGTWTTSGGGAIPTNLTALDHIKNSQTTLDAGSYKLSISGSGGPDTLGVSYFKSGNYGVLSAIEIEGSGNYDQSVTFVVPYGGLYGGELIVGSSNGIGITDVCLQSLATPTPPSGGIPVIPPIPECGNVNSIVPSPYTLELYTFYKLKPYIETTGILSGTLSTSVNWGRYLAMETYNYSMYPMVCTTISVANWQVHAFNALMTALIALQATIIAELLAINVLLAAILAALLVNTLLVLLILGAVLALVLALIVVVTGILGIIFVVLSSAMGILLALLGYAQMGGGASYAVNFAGDAKWLAFPMAGIIALDTQFGQWLSVITTIALAALSFRLALYVVGQVRAMMEPGAGSDKEDEG